LQVKRFRVLAAATAVAVAVGMGALAAPPAATASGISVTRVCPAAAPGHATCFALHVTGAGQISAHAGPAGYHPADLVSAYGLDPSKGAGQKIAIIDAYNNPNAESDLGVYRSTFGLPPCTTANGCFKKVNQDGNAAPLPPNNYAWGVEIALDLDMASAICPKCKLLLVEASTNDWADIVKAVDRAAIMGATVISNSYGGNANAEAVALASHYNHPGIPITASSGDGGYADGPNAPAAFSTVTAVGGTTLKHATNARGWKETVWSGAGSGCATRVAKPAWQHDTLCAGRTIADVSAVANPATGVTVYNTFGYSGFVVVGGTSASAPIIAGIYALAGNGSAINDASYIYSHSGKLYDVKKGSNGSCGSTYLCTGKIGYDAPTGLGTPKGSLAF
jgi:subtilase family serine protease